MCCSMYIYYQECNHLSVASPELSDAELSSFIVNFQKKNKILLPRTLYLASISGGVFVDSFREG